MAKYKVLNAFDIGGVTQEVGSEVELTSEQVENFGIGNLEIISEESADTSEEKTEEGASEEKGEEGAEGGSQE